MYLRLELKITQFPDSLVLRISGVQNHITGPLLCAIFITLKKEKQLSRVKRAY